MMKYAIEFDIPDNETTRKSIKTDRVQWRFLGYGGYCMAQPVIHAHWIIGGTHEYDERVQNIMHCSNCKALFRYHGRKQNVNYCYKCGAKMDEEVDDE